MNNLGFGEWLKSKREGHGYSQLRLAEAAGVDRAHLIRMEKGRVTFPADETRAKLHAVFGTTDESLVEEGVAVRREYPRADGTTLVKYEPAPGVRTVYRDRPDRPGGEATKAEEGQELLDRVVALAQQVSWDAAKFRTIEGVLRLMIDPREDAWDIELSHQEDNTADMTPDDARRRREAAERRGSQ